jgi:hypothetical protein
MRLMPNPPRLARIFDEAHELEDVAGSYFGVSISNARFEELCRDVEVSLQRNHMLSASISGALKSVRERAPFFFALLPQGDGRFSFENRREFMEENGDEFLGLQQSLGRLGSELENLPSKPEEVFNFARRAQELQVQLAFLMESEDRNTVFWIERRLGGRDRQNVFLQATPIDVAPILKTCLFDKLECAVLTSATNGRRQLRIYAPARAGARPKLCCLLTLITKTRHCSCATGPSAPHSAIRGQRAASGGCWKCGRAVLFTSHAQRMTSTSACWESWISHAAAGRCTQDSSAEDSASPPRRAIRYLIVLAG